MNEIITSPQNPQVKIWRSLNKSRAARIENGLFLAEGEHMAGEALQEHKARALLIDERARAKFAALAEKAAAQGVLVFTLSSRAIESLCDAKTPQGVVAVCGMPQGDASLVPGDLLAALDGVQDPGNVGTVIRTADAAGFHAVLIDDKTADPFGPKALRASMGGVFRVPVVRCESLPDRLRALASAGYEIVAGDLHGKDFYRRPPARDKICIVIGSEGQGVSPEVLAEATMRLKIPMPGKAESLNAAVAGAIMMYDFLRERLI